MKHIIIAGPSRSGKTTLSLMFGKLGFVHYKMDSIKRGIDRNFWDGYKDDWRKVSPHMSHLIKTIINENASDIVKDKEYYVIDTCHIYPVDIYNEHLENTIIVFLGYANTKIEDKFKFIRKSDQKLWSSELDDEELKEYIQIGIDYSIEARDECKKYNIKYFDIGNNFKKSINKAYEYILKELEKDE